MMRLFPKWKKDPAAHGPIEPDEPWPEPPPAEPEIDPKVAAAELRAALEAERDELQIETDQLLEAARSASGWDPELRAEYGAGLERIAEIATALQVNMRECETCLRTGRVCGVCASASTACMCVPIDPSDWLDCPACGGEQTAVTTICQLLVTYDRASRGCQIKTIGFPVADRDLLRAILGRVEDINVQQFLAAEYGIIPRAAQQAQRIVQPSGEIDIKDLRGKG